MAFRLPKFNLWGRLWFVNCPEDNPASASYDDGPWYFRCQMRSASHGSTVFQLEVEKGMNFRPANHTPFLLGDRIQLAGWRYMYAHIYNVSDVGCGFPNEHRSVLGVFPDDVSWDHHNQWYPIVVNPDLQPPDGAQMLTPYTTWPTWEDPFPPFPVG